MRFQDKNKQRILELCYRAINNAESDLIDSAIVPLSNFERFEEQCTIQFDLHDISIGNCSIGTSLVINGKFCNDVDKY